MVKYKRKLKVNKMSSIVIVLVFILLSMSIGYCVWTDNQIIVGNINVKYKEPRLLDISVPEESGRYITVDEENQAKDAYEFKNGKLIDNADRIEVIGNLDTHNGLIWVGRTVKIACSFNNNTGYTLTDLQYEKLPFNADGNANKKEFGYSTSISVPESIKNGESASITVSFDIPSMTYPYKKDRNSKL